MEVKLDSIATTPTSLRFGGVVRGPENSWVRFVTIVVEDASFTQPELVALVVWATRVLNRYLDTEPLEDHTTEDPLF